MKSAVYGLFQPPADRLRREAGKALSEMEQVLYRSHAVGSDQALAREGGGSFSAKGTAVDHRGDLVRVMWMSAWGCDGASTTPEDFPAVRLDDLCLLRNGDPVSESEMIDYLLTCSLKAGQLRPGIETLLHAFIPASHVDHCHPDAIIALTAIPEGKDRVAKEFGDEAIWFDYQQFSVDVARQVADRIEANPCCRFVIMSNHGLFTWADTSEQCYQNSLEAVGRAVRALGESMRLPTDLGGRAVDPLPAEPADDMLAQVLPIIRGSLSIGTVRTILNVDRSADAVEFASSVRGPQLTQVGPSCVDHLVTVGFRPLVLEGVATGGRVDPQLMIDQIDAFRSSYDAYYERHISPDGRAVGRRTDMPRVVILPGVGVVSSGPEAAKARLCSDHISQAMTVIRAADASGGYLSLTEAQGIADEYWPLMRFKPQLRFPRGDLGGRVFLIAGQDSERMAAIAEHLAAADAHTVLACGEPEAAARAAAGICAQHGERTAVAVSCESGAGSAVRGAVLEYGGFDAVVDTAPDGGLADAVLAVFELQDCGGTIVLASGDRSAGVLRQDVTALAPDAAPRGVTVNAVTSADPAVVARAAAFFGGPAGGIWNGTVLEAAPAEAGQAVTTSTGRYEG
jgi:rhamnose utilization protein RhaD (predicted bifunctional aldolase and dehydrogenase)